MFRVFSKQNYVLTLRWSLRPLLLILFVCNILHAQIPEIKKGQPLPANIFIELAKIVNPAVVNIYTTSLPQTRQRQRFNDPLMEMLEQFYGPMRSRPQQSLGTGFIIREDGLIITNNHVVEGADIIKVQLEERDDKNHEAKIIGRDARYDIALIKIEAKKKLATAKLGDSSKVEVGEWVAAFGNPIGLGHSMTKGIISAVARAIDEINRVPVLQTDASINPGNSGGPLVNLQGEVIGVNNAIAAAGGGGISFAIPINAIRDILPTLEKDGVIKRGFIGVFLDRVGEQSKEALGLKVDSGALVVDVMAGGPAAKSGLKPYDVIEKFGDKTIEGPEDLTRAVGDTQVNRSVEVTVNRFGKTVKSRIVVQEHPDDKTVIRRISPEQAKGAMATDFGFQITDSNSKIARDMGLPKLSVSKPVVASVAPGSPAAAAGLQAGDIIVDVNRQAVSNPPEVNRALIKGKSNVLRIRRGDRPLFVQIVP